MINFLQLLFMILLICISCGGNKRSLRNYLPPTLSTDARTRETRAHARFENVINS